MPTYNRWDLVRERIAELAEAQAITTLGQLRLVVVDDYSATPCPPKLMRAIYDVGGRYMRLHRNSGSVSIPRSVGIANSEGDYIAHIDDDVHISSHRFDTLLPHFCSGVDLVYGAAQIQNMDGSLVESYIPEWNPCAINGWGVDGGQFIYRRNVFDRIPIHFALRGCDWELAKRIYSGNNFVSVNVLVSKYVWHGQNRSLDQATKNRPIFPSNYKMYFRHWAGLVDYTPIPAI